jgi:hypothetical protein
MDKKPIIILGKGPSALYLPKSNKYDVAACNNATWLCEEPTYTFYNDIEPMELTTFDDFQKIKTLIVPSFLHSQCNPRFNGISKHVHFYELQVLFPDDRFDNIDIMIYELHKGDNDKIEEQSRINSGGEPAPMLDEWPRSCGVTAANFLAKFLNYKDFIFAGMDPEGGYHPKFRKKKLDENNNPAFNGHGTEAQPAGYDLDYNQMVKLVQKYGGKARHINDVSEEEKKDLGLL